MRCALLSLALLPLCAGYVKTTWSDLAANPAYSFDDYVAEYGKTYASTAEHAARKAAFEANLERIRAHNAAGHSWKMGLNHLSDVAHGDREGLKPYTGKVVFNRANLLGAERVAAAAAAADVPDRMDWREFNAMTPVKNQGACGSCWAFSASESLESHLFISTGKLLEIAPQQFVDCAPNPHHCGGTGGCHGATPEIGFAFAVANGTTTAAHYPYQAATGTCNTDDLVAVAGFKGYKQLPANDDEALRQALGTEGPVSISLDATEFHSYESGVFMGSDSCSDVNHAVQAVGYGVDSEFGAYWLVRNSWGASWGEEGYIRMQRHAKGEVPCYTDKTPKHGSGCDGEGPREVCGTCGMLSDSSYPFGGYLKEAY